MHSICSALHVALGAVCALGAGAAVTYVASFYLAVSDQHSIDVESPWHHPSLLSSNSLLNNTLLLLIFCVLHSLFARQWVKDLLSPLIPPAIYRQFYFIMSSLSFSLTVYGWSPLPYLLWNLEALPARYGLFAISILGLALTTVAFFTVQPLEFCGIQQSLWQLTGSGDKESDNKLVITGVYRYVRHPMYTGVLISLWSQPTMSQGRLLVALFLTLYLLVAVPNLEEPDLIKEFGQPYKTYMKTTPMFLPLPSFRGAEKSE